MSKLIILTSGHYDNYSIHGVFTTTEKAHEFAILARIEEPDFEEWNLDPILVWKQIYSVWIDLDGNIISKAMDNDKLLHPSYEWKRTETRMDGFFAQSSNSYNQALEFAQQARAQWLKDFPDAQFYYGGSYGRKLFNRGDGWHINKYWHKAGERVGHGDSLYNGTVSCSKEGDVMTYIAFAKTEEQVMKLINAKRRELGEKF